MKVGESCLGEKIKVNIIYIIRHIKKEKYFDHQEYNYGNYPFGRQKYPNGPK